MQVEEFEVQEIIQKRTIPRGNSLVTEYKVRWKGYSAAEATWEPVQNMDGCLPMIEEFESRKRRKKEPKLPAPPKAAGKNQRQKTAKRETKLPQYDFASTYRDELYFSDQSNYHPQEMQLPPQEDYGRAASQRNQEQLEANQEKIQEKTPMPDGREQRKRRQRKRDILSANANKMQVEQQQAQKDASFATISEEFYLIPKRSAEDELIIQSVALDQDPVPIKYQTVQTQTDAPDELPALDPPIKIISMHSSRQFPGKIWFTVRSKDQYWQYSREKLYESDPKALYQFYHKYYLKSRQKAAEARQLLEEMMQPENREEGGEEGEESSEDSSCSIDYPDLMNLKQDSLSRRRLEKYARQEKRRKVKQTHLDKSLRD